MMPLKSKDQQEKISALLRAHGVSLLYHFTDGRNWPLIKSRGGLYSLADCRSRGFNVPRPGGTAGSAVKDQKLQHDRFVHLCFHWDQPMKYVRQQKQELGPCVILGVSPEVALWRDTRFSDVNASAGYAQIGDDAMALERVKLKIATRGYGRLIYKSETAKGQIQAEVLVPEHIPLSLITVHLMEAGAGDTDDDSAIPF
jgi:hypothetical protein